MSESTDIPVVFPAEIEAKIQKIARHTGYTRDEVIQEFVTSLLDLADQPSDKIELPGFALTVKKALRDASLER